MSNAPLRQDPTPDIKSLIQTQVGVLNDCGIILDELHRCINWGDVECPHFYGLPKVHKTIPPGSKLPPMRGIISSVKGPTTRASYYLDSVLNPLVPAYCGDHWCKDTTHILQEIDALNRNTVSYSSETHTLSRQTPWRHNVDSACSQDQWFSRLAFSLQRGAHFVPFISTATCLPNWTPNPWCP